MVEINETINTKIALDESVVDFYFVENGISVTNSTKETNAIQLNFESQKELGKLDIYMNFGDGNYQLTSLYTYATEDKVFVSSESEDDAWYKGTTYKYDQGLMTDAEVENAYGVFSRRDVVEEIITDSTTEQLSEENLAQLSPKTVTRAGKTTYVKGRLYWTTSTNVMMPLKHTRVDLYDDEPIGGVYLQQTYTDSNGYYSFSFQNPDGFWDFENGGYDVYRNLGKHRN